jgi:hypothetical protein
MSITRAVPSSIWEYFAAPAGGNGLARVEVLVFVAAYAIRDAMKEANPRARPQSL